MSDEIDDLVTTVIGGASSAGPSVPLAGIELLVIDGETRTREFAKELRWNEAYYRLVN